MLASVMMGMKKYNDIFERRKRLQSIYDGSIKIRETIRCMHSPLHECFLYGGEFFVLASEKIRSGVLPEEAVKECAGAFLALTNDDKSIIERFARGLGAEDCKGQLSNMELFVKDLETALFQATQELNTRGKLYVKGSILASAAIVLLLI